VADLGRRGHRARGLAELSGRRRAGDDPLERVRAICLALPETSERPSHGAPTFFIRGKRSFATMYLDGLRLDRGAAWSEVEAVIEDAFMAVAPVRLADAARSAR
jgi:hypothetical protein